MKIKDGFMLRQIAGSYVVIAYGKNAVDFNGMISLNDTGAFLWKKISEGRTRDELVSDLLEEYSVDKSVAQKDVDAFLKKIEDAGVAE